MPQRMERSLSRLGNALRPRALRLRERRAAVDNAYG
jgi:hypothetical protein